MPFARRRGSLASLTGRAVSACAVRRQVLLRFRAPPNIKDAANNTPLAVALRTGNEEICRAIHAAGGELGWDEMETASQLCEVARAGDIERLRLLLSIGAQLRSADYDKRTPLHLAASVGNLRIVDFIINHSACNALVLNAVDRWGGTPLRDAIREGHREVALHLRKVGACLGKAGQGQAAGELCALAQKGDLEGVRLLLTCGGDVNAADYDQRRCIHLSASEGNRTLCEYLIQNGAQINCKDRCTSEGTRTNYRSRRLCETTAFASRVRQGAAPRSTTLSARGTASSRWGSSSAAAASRCPRCKPQGSCARWRAAARSSA